MADTISLFLKSVKKVFYSLAASAVLGRRIENVPPHADRVVLAVPEQLRNAAGQLLPDAVELCEFVRVATLSS